MADLKTKYLDYTGLGRFLAQLKEYIGGEISKIHGDNLYLHDSGENNPTITSQIEDIWELLGVSDGVNGSLAENIATILGEYVKSINVPTDQNLPITLKIEEVDDEDNKGRFTISLEDNGLNDALTAPKVTSLNTANDGGDVTLSLDNTSGAVTITVNSKNLTEKLAAVESGLETEISNRENADLALGTRIDDLNERIDTIEGSYVKSIKTSNNNTDSSYIDITPSDKTNGDVEIIINDSALHEKLTKIDKDIADEIENREKEDEVLDGKIGEVAADLGTLGGTVDGLSGKLDKEIEDRIAEDGKLDERIKSIESNYVKSIKTTNSNENTKYVTISPTEVTNGEVTVTINDAAVFEKFEDLGSKITQEIKDRNAGDLALGTRIDNLKETVDTINGSYVKSVKVTGSNGITAGPTTSTKGDVNITVSGLDLENKIAALGKVVNVKGVYPADTDLSSIEGEDGDFIIVGQKEYVYWTETTSGENGTKWVLLGDVTLVSQELSDLIDVYNDHTHKFTPSGTVNSTFTGTAATTSNSSLSISYSAGKLTINTSHNHGYTPSGTVNSTFTGTEQKSGNTNLIKTKHPLLNSGGSGNVDWSKEYLTFENTGDNPVTISLTLGNKQNLNYKLGSNEWATATSIELPVGQSVKLRGEYTPVTSSGIGIFNITGDSTVDVKGNAMSLLYGDNFKEQTSLSGKNYAFCKLFTNCTAIVNANELILPATTLADYCYQYMFQRCTNLTTAPELPATTLASWCYQYMFTNCSSLTTAPELPATTLASMCYQYMFQNCTNLTTAPAELPATTLTSHCYYCMFQNCTNLTTAPELPAPTLADSCYFRMFYKCSKLNNITMLATDLSARLSLSSWVYNVASTGTFTKHKDLTSYEGGASGIPAGWTVIDKT